MKTQHEHLVKMTYSNSNTSVVWAYPTKRKATKSMEQVELKFPSIKAEYVGIKFK
jgi:hypothetical protein